MQMVGKPVSLCPHFPKHVPWNGRVPPPHPKSVFLGKTASYNHHPHQRFKTCTCDRLSGLSHPNLTLLARCSPTIWIMVPPHPSFVEGVPINVPPGPGHHNTHPRGCFSGLSYLLHLCEQGGDPSCPTGTCEASHFPQRTRPFGCSDTEVWSWTSRFPFP